MSGTHQHDRWRGFAVGQGSMWRWLRRAFGLIGLGFILAALAATWDTRAALPSAGAVGIAFCLTLGILVTVPYGWVALFERPDITQALTDGFYAALPGKYIPGAIWHAAGQVGYSVAAGVPLRQATAVIVVHNLVQLAAGGVVGGLAGLSLPGNPAWIRILGFGAVCTGALLHRTALQGIVRLAGYVMPRFGGVELIPSQRAILQSFGWSVAGVLLSGAAFAVLYGSAGTSSGAAVLGAMLGFTLAWTVGFLALPFPAGIGVREAVLVTLLNGGTASILTAAAGFRFLSVIAELLAYVVGRAQSAHRGGRLAQSSERES